MRLRALVDVNDCLVWELGWEVELLIVLVSFHALTGFLDFQEFCHWKKFFWDPRKIILSVLYFNLIQVY